jgi:hypothetical protein
MEGMGQGDQREEEHSDPAQRSQLVAGRLFRKSFGKCLTSMIAPVGRNANVEVPAFAVLFQRVVDSPELQKVDHLLEPLALRF